MPDRATPAAHADDEWRDGAPQDERSVDAGEGFPRRPRVSPAATIASLAAAAAMAGIATLGDRFGWGMLTGFAFITALVLAIATVLSVIPRAHAAGLVLVWNAIGLGIALLVAGMFGVGAIFLIPIALMSFAAMSWPRDDNLAITGAGLVALGGGLLTIPAAWALGWLTLGGLGDVV